MKMHHHRVLMCSLLSAHFAAACFQELDTGATKGTVVVVPPGPDEIADPGDGSIPTLTTTPAIDIVDDPSTAYTDPNAGVTGKTTAACDATRSQAMAVLTKYCAGCHGGRTPGENSGTPPWNFVLDVKLLTSKVLTPQFSTPLVVPGDPDRSELYTRIASGRMPSDPNLPVGTIIPPSQSDGVTRPTVSDVSLMRQWIESCL